MSKMFCIMSEMARFQHFQHASVFLAQSRTSCLGNPIACLGKRCFFPCWMWAAGSKGRGGGKTSTDLHALEAGFRSGGWQPYEQIWRLQNMRRGRKYERDHAWFFPEAGTDLGTTFHVFCGGFLWVSLGALGDSLIRGYAEEKHR